MSCITCHVFLKSLSKRTWNRNPNSVNCPISGTRSRPLESPAASQVSVHRLRRTSTAKKKKNPFRERESSLFSPSLYLIFFQRRYFQLLIYLRGERGKRRQLSLVIVLSSLIWNGKWEPRNRVCRTPCSLWLEKNGIFFFFFPFSYVYIPSSVSEEEKRGFFFNGLVAEIVVELNGLSF